MKITILTTALFVFSLSLVFSQDKETKTLEETIENFRTAMLNGDGEQLKALTMKELTYGHSNGLMEDQTAFVEALASGKSDFTEINLQDQSIDIVGKTALVRHNLIGKTNSGGVAADVRIGILLIWQKNGKNWQLLARQAYKL